MLTISFSKDRETKNAIRYQEQFEGERGLMGTIYLLKSAAEQIGNPETLTISIESAAAKKKIAAVK